MVNGANVVQADIKAKNGVIHVIDAVILPPAEEAAPTEAPAAAAPGNIAEVAAAAGSFARCCRLCRRQVWQKLWQAKVPSPSSPPRMRRLPPCPPIN